MSSNPNPPPGDALARAAAAVTGTAVPDPPADLVAAVSAAVLNRLTLAAAADAARRRRRTWIMRGISVGGLAACLAVAATWDNRPATAGELLVEALANQKPTAAVKSTETTEQPGKPPRREVYYTQGGRTRHEYAGSRSYGVTDFATSRHVQFFRDTDFVLRNTTSRMQDPDPAVTWVVRSAASRFAVGDTVAGRAVEPLGEQPVGDRKLPAFRVRGLKTHRPGEQTLVFDPADATYWVDPAIKRVVREVVEVTAGPKPRTVTTDIEWLERPLDPKLFDMEAADWAWLGDTPAAQQKPERTRPVSLTVALENQQKAKSFRLLVRTTMANTPTGGKPTEQKMFGQGAKVRVEMGHLTSVADGDAGRMVLLDAKAKVARVGDAAFIKGGAGHPEVADAVKKLLAKEGAEDLGEKFLDGRKVHVYRVKGLKLGEQTMDVTYTVDAKRELPVRVEQVIAGGPVSMTQTFDYLGFDEELDPKLFSLDIPEGYKREELKLPAAKK